MMKTLRILWLLVLSLVLGLAVQAQQRFNNLTILSNLTVNGSATITNLTGSLTNVTVDGESFTNFAVTPKMFGAVGDGVTDDSVPLQQWLDCGATNLFLPAQTYITGSRLELTRSGVHIDWYGTIKATTNINNHVFLVGGAGYSSVTNNTIYPQLNNITIDGHGIGVLDGSSTNATECFNPDGSFIYSSQGIYFYGVSNAVVKGMTIRNAVTFALGFNQCQSVLVEGTRVDNGNGNGSALYNGKNADGIHWTDCKDVIASDLDVRSSDDCLSITSIWAACSRFNISNVRLTHSMIGVGSYLTLGHCIRVSPDSIALPGATISGVTLTDFDMTGGHAAMVIGHGGATYYTSNVRLADGIVHDFTDDGNATYKSTVLGLVDEVSGLTISGVTFTNCTKAISFQDNIGTEFVACRFLNFGENQYLTTWAPIIFDGAQGATLGASITGCIFDGIWQQGIRAVGGGVSDRITITGNRMANGGQNVAMAAATGYSAISLSDLTDGATVSQNEIVNWAGSGISATSIPVLKISDNLIDNAGNGLVTAAYGIAATATAGTLMDELMVTDNYIVRSSANAILENNYTVLAIHGNVLIDNLDITGTGGHMQIGFNGTGATPNTVDCSGEVSNNHIVSSVGNALVSVVTSTPTYSGAPISILGNSSDGMSQIYSLDGAYCVEASILSLPIVTGSTAASSAGRNYMRHAVTSTATTSAALYVERIQSGAGALSSSMTSANILNRVQGSGGISGSPSFYGATVLVSADRTDPVLNVSGASIGARSTSTGAVTNASGVSAYYTASGGNVTANVYGVDVLGPTLSGGSTISAVTGVRIQTQARSGVTNSYGIVQSGSSDTNTFAGPTIFSNAVTFSGSGIELGNATDTTLARSSAGVVTIEGVKVATQPTTETLSYSGTTVTVTGGKGPNQSSVLTCTNNFTLSFSSVADNDGGTIWVHPAVTNCTVTLSSPAYGPSGTTLTIAGGGATPTNHTILAWKATTVNSTNVINVNALNYYR